MIKVALNSPTLYEFLIRRLPWLKYFIVIRISQLHHLRYSESISRLFQYTFVSDGPSKQTEASRFDDLNEFLFRHLNPGQSYTIHDVGCV